MRRVLALAVLLALAGCGAQREAQPGIGSGADTYKRSPCACLAVPQHYPPGWLQRAFGA